MSEDWRVTHAIYERFQSRRLTTPAIELVGVMGGVMLIVMHGMYRKRVRAIVASEWKRAVDKAGGEGTLQAQYDFAAEYGIKPHTVDSIGIGCYGAAGYAGRLPFPLETYKRLVKDVCKRGLGEYEKPC